MRYVKQILNVEGDISLGASITLRSVESELPGPKVENHALYNWTIINTHKILDRYILIIWQGELL